MKRMLINATQPEELRVAIVDGQTLQDLDIEVPGHGQKKDNIYKGRVSRVEPSLEACFVEYGAERHGFLPLREVAPAYHHGEAEPGKRLSIKDAVESGQEVLVQVTKEERGSKGAALTTYISLAGRYLVLMPNNPGAGGVSSKIAGPDRDDTRAVLAELDLPQGAGVIVRTAGGGRSLEQLQWDLDYLKNTWEAICNATDERPAPFLVYQESNVIIRALRDHFARDIGEVIIDDVDVLEEARGFVEMVMPQHLGKLKHHEDRLPLFTRFQIESQIDAAFQRQVRLPSGGSLVLDQTEALVSVDVNSARATQGSGINETALNTNIEAAAEIARQLRLRDIGGLIVVDFIDMNGTRNLREVEKKLRHALELDRARIQVGRISRFGLLEMSRQRLRPALSEAVFEPCPRCSGKGVIRSVESLAISILRRIQKEALKERTARVTAELPVSAATFLINEKRSDLADIETRQGIGIVIVPNPYIETPNFSIERIRSDQLSSHAQSSHELLEAPQSPAMPDKPAGGEKPAVSTLRPETPPPAAAAKNRAGRGWLARLLGGFAAPEPHRAHEGGSPGNAQRKRSGSNRNRRTGRDSRSKGARGRSRRPASSSNGARNRRGPSQRSGSNRTHTAAGKSSREEDAGKRRKATQRDGGNHDKPTAESHPDSALRRSTQSAESGASKAGRQNPSAGGGNGGAGRSRTRRGRRGGRRHHGARNGRSQANRATAANDAAADANHAQGGRHAKAAEQPAGIDSAPPERRGTSAAGREPASKAGRRSEPPPATGSGTRAKEAPPAESTPRLAALFEQEKRDEAAHGGEKS